MSTISLGPVVDAEPPSSDLATMMLYKGEVVLMCVCLMPIEVEDVSRGLHRCGRTIRVVVTHDD